MSNAAIVRPVTMPTITASSTASGYAAGNVANDFMGVVWKSSAAAVTDWLTVDFGADVTIDTILVLGCTGATAGWTLEVWAATAAQGSSFTTKWTSGTLTFLAGSAMTSTGRGRALWTAPTSGGPPAARYWRVRLNDPSGTSFKVVGRLVMGNRITLARNFQFGAAFALRELGSADWSAHGVFLRRKAVRLRSVGITFGNVYKDEVENVVHPLVEAIGGTDAIALITDPAAHAQRQNRIFFGPLMGDLGTIWARANGFEWKANCVDLEAVGA